MQGIDATFDDLSFEGGDSPRRVLLKILPGAAAVALAGAVGVWVLHWRGSPAPEAIFSRWTSASPVALSPAFSKPFGDIVVDANLLAQLKRPAAPAAPSPQVASLEAAPRVPSAPFPLPSLEPFAPAPAPPIPPVGSLPTPPARDLPEIGETESFPLPPPRPPELAMPTQPAHERHASRPELAVPRPAAPADNRNIFEKLLGWTPVLADGCLRSDQPHDGPGGCFRRARPRARPNDRRRAKGEGRERPRQGPAVRLPVALRRFCAGLRL